MMSTVKTSNAAGFAVAFASKAAMLLSAFVLCLCLSSCDKDDSGSGSSKLSKSLVGQWELTNVEFVTRSAQVGDETVTVYMEFLSDGTFSLAQIVGAGRYQTYTGTWTLTGDTLSGRYSDGVRWGADYQISISDDILTMTVDAFDSGTGITDIYTYRRTTIPDGVF